MGHLPPCGRTGACPADRVGAAGPRRGDREARRAAGMDPAGGLARGAARHLRVGAVLRRAAAVLRRGIARDGGALRGARATDGHRRPPAGRDRRPGHHGLPDLARRKPADPRPRPARRAACGRPRPGPRPGVPGHAPPRARGREPRPVAGGARHRDRGRGLLPRDRPRRPAAAGPIPSRTFERSRSSVHERRPVYSEVHGGSTLRGACRR